MLSEQARRREEAAKRFFMLTDRREEARAFPHLVLERQEDGTGKPLAMFADPIDCALFCGIKQDVFVKYPPRE